MLDILIIIMMVLLANDSTISDRLQKKFETTEEYITCDVVNNPKFGFEIQQAAMHLYPSVNIVWISQNATNCIKAALQSCVEKKQIHGYISVSPVLNQNKTLDLLVFNEKFAFNKNLGSYLNKKNKKHLVVVIENTDLIWKHRQFESFIMSLRSDMRMHPYYVVLLAISNFDVASMILSWSNDIVLISLDGKLNEASQYVRLPRTTSQYVQLSRKIINYQNDSNVCPL